MIVVLLCGACRQGAGSSSSPLSGDPSQPDCGFAVVDLDSLPGACTAGETIAGPVTYHREAGKPERFELPFESENGAVCVSVTSGAGRRDRVTAAEVALDETLVIAPAAFNPGVERVEREIAVTAGAHLLATRVASRPGSFLTVEARFAPAGRRNPVVGADGRIETFDLVADPIAVVPGGAPGDDTTRLSMTVAFIPPVPGDAGNATYELAAEFQLASGATCDSIITLETSVSLAEPGRTVLVVTWDGTDGDGHALPVGRHFFRAVVTATRIQGGHRSLLDTATSGVQVVHVGEAPEYVAGLDGSEHLGMRSPADHTAAEAARLQAEAHLRDPLVRLQDLRPLAAHAVRADVTRFERRVLPLTKAGVQVSTIEADEVDLAVVEELLGDTAGPLTLILPADAAQLRVGRRYLVIFRQDGDRLILLESLAELPGGDFELWRTRLDGAVVRALLQEVLP